MTIKMTPAVAAKVQAEVPKLATMPKHWHLDYRPVVVVAREGNKRPVAVLRYHTEPVGASTTVDGYDAAIVAAE